MNTIECKKCNSVDFPHLTYMPKNNAIKASCRVCGKYIKFLSSDELMDDESLIFQLEKNVPEHFRPVLTGNISREIYVYSFNLLIKNI
jgi:hypothetical protein